MHITEHNKGNKWLSTGIQPVVNEHHRRDDHACNPTLRHKIRAGTRKIQTIAKRLREDSRRRYND